MASKKLKRDIEGNIDEPSKKTKITQKRPGVKFQDLNYDVLFEIFKYLSIEDLVYIVEYDNSCEIAARDVFRRKFGENLITISNAYRMDDESVPWSVKLLKYFGGSIKMLHIKYEEDHRRGDILCNNAVIAYCHKTLTKIEFENGKIFETDIPFERVLNVTFTNSEFDNILSDFSNWFPSAHTMDLIGRSSNQSEIKPVTHHPSLRHVKCIKTNPINIHKLLALNRQLENAWIESDALKCNKIGHIEENDTIIPCGIKKSIHNLRKVHIVCVDGFRVDDFFKKFVFGEINAINLMEFKFSHQDEELFYEKNKPVIKFREVSGCLTNQRILDGSQDNGRFF